VRIRMGIFTALLVVVLGLVLGACSSDPESGDPPSPSDSPSSDSPSSPTLTTEDSVPLTEITIDCPEFAEVAQKLTAAQTALYDGSGTPAVMDDLIAELAALKEGAPAGVQTALDKMAEAFRDAAEILANPTAENQARLAELGPKLADAGQKITAYFTSQCG
jgi:hypothetical protein